MLILNDPRHIAFLGTIRDLRSVNKVEVFFMSHMDKKHIEKVVEKWSTKNNKNIWSVVYELGAIEDVRIFLNKYFSGEELLSLYTEWLDRFGYFKYLMFNKKLIVVSITHDCNVNCWYCKISHTKSRASHMSLDNFSKVLDWLEAQGIKLFILTGGEPTFHPEFKKMIDLCRKRGFQVAFYSNFFFEEDMLDLFAPDVFYRITGHYNTQYENDKVKMDKFYKNVRSIMDRGIEFESRFVLYKNNNYEKFINFVKDFNLPFFTVNLVHPSIYDPRNILSEEKIDEWRKLLFDFIDVTRKNNLKFFISKPMPRCLFTDQEFDELKDKMKIWTTCVDRSQITVKPDLKVTWCNTDLFRPIKSIFDYRTMEEWQKYFWQYVEPLYWDAVSMPKCKNCEYFINKECQGACLAFKDIGQVPKSEVFNYKNKAI